MGREYQHLALLDRQIPDLREHVSKFEAIGLARPHRDLHAAAYLASRIAEFPRRDARNKLSCGAVSFVSVTPACLAQSHRFN